MLNPELSPEKLVYFVWAIYRNKHKDNIIGEFDYNLVQELKNIVMELHTKREENGLKPILKTRKYINYGLRKKEFLSEMNKLIGKTTKETTLARIQNFIDQQKDPHLLSQQYVSDSLTKEFGMRKGFSLRNIKTYWKQIKFPADFKSVQDFPDRNELILEN